MRSHKGGSRTDILNRLLAVLEEGRQPALSKQRIVQKHQSALVAPQAIFKVLEQLRGTSKS